MTRLDATSQLVRYEDDYYAWVLGQIGLLKAGRFADLDVPNLVNIEE